MRFTGGIPLTGNFQRISILFTRELGKKLSFKKKQHGIKTRNC